MAFVEAQGGTVQHIRRDDKAAHAALAAQQIIPCDRCGTRMIPDALNELMMCPNPVCADEASHAPR